MYGVVINNYFNNYKNNMMTFIAFDIKNQENQPKMFLKSANLVHFYAF